jgi:hypothetical protein
VTSQSHVKPNLTQIKFQNPPQHKQIQQGEGFQKATTLHPKSDPEHRGHQSKPDADMSVDCLRTLLHSTSDSEGQDSQSILYHAASPLPNFTSFIPLADPEDLGYLPTSDADMFSYQRTNAPAFKIRSRRSRLQLLAQTGC